MIETLIRAFEGMFPLIIFGGGILGIIFYFNYILPRGNTP